MHHFYDKITNVFQNDPTLKQILKVSDGNPILGSFHPTDQELKITPVLKKAMSDYIYPGIDNSLPVVWSKNEPLIFREYS